MVNLQDTDDVGGELLALCKIQPHFMHKTVNIRLLVCMPCHGLMHPSTQNIHVLLATNAEVYFVYY